MSKPKNNSTRRSSRRLGDSAVASSAPTDQELAHIAPELRRFAVAIDSLVLDPHNARLHGEKDLASTQASLKRFGQQHLVHFDPDNQIVKIGNGRVAGGRALGWKYIAAIPSNLSGAALKAFAIADNRTGEQAGWDEEELAVQIEELRETDMDLDALGLSDKDVEEMLSDAAPEPAPAGDKKRPSERLRELADQWVIIVQCESEQHQLSLLEKFQTEGLECKAQVA
jgi:ParB-like chromosome segregation protein Spo0J